MFIDVTRRLKFCKSKTEAVLLMQQARNFVRRCKFGATDIRLDKYMREFKHMTLREAC